MNRKTTSGGFWIFTFVIAVVLVGSIWGASFYVVVSQMPPTSIGEGETAQGNWGLFGDSFGAVNALFSGLAFAGVVVAIFLQREELRAQQEEFEKHTREFRKQNEVMDAQVEMMRHQAQENHLFQLLNAWRLAAQGIRCYNEREGKSEGFEGDAALEYLLSKFVTAMTNDNRLVNARANNDPDRWKLIAEKFAGNECVTRSLFALMVNCIRYIEKVEASKQADYIDLVRSHLTDSELEALMYQGISEHVRGDKSLYESIERYHLLRHVSRQSLSFPQDLSFYGGTWQKKLWSDYETIVVDPKLSGEMG